MSKLQHLALLFAATTTLVTAACSAGTGDGATGGQGGTASGNNGTASGPNGSNGTGFLTGSGGGGVASGCSADLQKVVDAQGNVVMSCPPDQGCYGGQCIPACDAAAKSQGSVGCDFRAPVSPFYQDGAGSLDDGPCYAVFLANTWGRDAKVLVDRGGTMYDATQFAKIPSGLGASTTYAPMPATGIPPNQVAVLFLAHKPGTSNFTSLECPVPPAFLGDAAVENAGIGTSFHVLSDTPVTAYDILPYGGATSYLPSATLLYPSSAWGTNYYAVAPHPDGGGKLWMLIAATEDATNLQIAPPTTLVGSGSVPTINGGQVGTLTLNAGQFAQWINSGTSGGMDPTGAIVKSDKPVAVYTGSTYLRVSSATSSGGGQDAAHQQLAPIQALGNEYVGGGVVTRLSSLAEEDVPYRMMGVVAGTTLTYDPGPPNGAPTTLTPGQVAEFSSTTFFSVTSQDPAHPFVFTQYLPGTQSGTRPGCAGPNPLSLPCGLGDEEWVSLVPPAQFLQHYVFFADPTYSTTNLVITRQKGPNGFADVNVACLGTVTGWLPVGSAGNYEVAHVDLSRAAVPVANCNGSNHQATSDGKFGIVVWGTDYYSSYAYPAGGNIGSINTVVVPPIPN